jgi:hypothetical protein
VISGVGAPPTKLNTLSDGPPREAVAGAFLIDARLHVSRSSVQGQLQLRGDFRKDFHQEGVVPAADATLHGDAVLGRMLLQE